MGLYDILSSKERATTNKKEKERKELQKLKEEERNIKQDIETMIFENWSYCANFTSYFELAKNSELQNLIIEETAKKVVNKYQNVDFEKIKKYINFNYLDFFKKWHKKENFLEKLKEEEEKNSIGFKTCDFLAAQSQILESPSKQKTGGGFRNILVGAGAITALNLHELVRISKKY